MMFAAGKGRLLLSRKVLAHGESLENPVEMLLGNISLEMLLCSLFRHKLAIWFEF